MIFNAVRLAAGAAALAGVAMLSGQEKPRDPIVVTIAKPAAVGRDRLGLFVPSRHTGLIVTVREYVPADRGTVSVVVHLTHAKTGARKEAGRFGIFPDQPFHAEGDEDVQRFRIPLDEEHVRLLKDSNVKVTVSLEPAAGSGERAKVTIESILWDTDVRTP